MVTLEWGPDGRPMRASGVPGEWVRFYGEPVQFQGPLPARDLLVPRREVDWRAVLSETGAQDVPLPAEPVA